MTAAPSTSGLLDLLGEAGRRELLSNARRIQLPAGTAVPRTRSATQLFVVEQGEVAIADGVAQRGHALELEAVLDGERWRFEWNTLAPTVLLSVDRAAFLSAVSKTPRLLEYLRLSSSEPVVRRFRNDLRLYGLAQSEIVRLIGRLRPISGTELRALSSSGFVLMQAGEVRVEGEIGRETRAAGPFRADEYFYWDTGRAQFEVDDDVRALLLPDEVLRDELGAASANGFCELADPIRARLRTFRRALERRNTSVTRAPKPPDELQGASVEEFKCTPAELRKLHKKRRRAVLQHDELDCGAACMSAVARFYGRRIDVAAYRSLVHVTRDGASMLALKRAAEKTGFRALGVAAGLKALAKARAPFIALMEYHFIVVYEIGESEVVASDPARGLVRIPIDQFKETWSQSALLLRPTDALYQYPESAPSYAKYLGLFRGAWLNLAEMLLASVLVFVLGLAVPVFLQYFTDTVLPTGNAGNLNLVAGLLLGVLLLESGLGWSRTRLLVEVASRLDAKLSSLFVKKLVRLPLSFFSVRTVGDITKRIDELEEIRSKVVNQLFGLVTVVFGGVINALVIGLYSPKLLGVLAAGLLVPMLFVRVAAPSLERVLQLLFDAEGKWQTRSWEQFSGLGSIKALASEVGARWRWARELDTTLELRRRFGRLQAAFGSASQLFNAGLTAAVLIAAVFLMLEGELTLGHVLAVTMLSGVVIRAAVNVLDSWYIFKELGVSVARIDDVITAAEEPTGGTRDDVAISGAIELENVTFQYGSELSPIVLEDLNLSIRAGETVALVGRSGSGKTTLGYMFNLLYAPTHGTIRFDGVPAEDIPLDHIRERVAMIVQDNSIFSGTILENIALGDAQPSFRDVVAAARRADAHDFITSMPEGYSTVLGESGAGLSGGQKQRINIARSLYRNPSVLIMDEATSALDVVSEGHIVRNLKARKGTTIIIAHRLNTVMHADRIVVLDQGEVVEEGTHHELLAQGGHYHRLFAKQLAA